MLESRRGPTRTNVGTFARPALIALAAALTLSVARPASGVEVRDVVKVKGVRAHHLVLPVLPMLMPSLVRW